jgi:hypothetical protein
MSRRARVAAYRCSETCLSANFADPSGAGRQVGDELKFEGGMSYTDEMCHNRILELDIPAEVADVQTRS